MGRPSGAQTGIKAIAAEAGVSIATVSRVLNGVTTTDPILRERVLAAAEKHA